MASYRIYGLYSNRSAAAALYFALLSILIPLPFIVLVVALFFLLIINFRAAPQSSFVFPIRLRASSTFRSPPF